MYVEPLSPLTLGKRCTDTSYPLVPRPTSKIHRQPILRSPNTEERENPKVLKSRSRDGLQTSCALLFTIIPSRDVSPCNDSGADSAFFSSKRRSSCTNLETLPRPGTRLGRPDSFRKYQKPGVVKHIDSAQHSQRSPCLSLGHLGWV